MARLIGVVGPGIVGMPMAALLAQAELRRGADGGRVLVVQRRSPSSGWKVDAINAGRSPIGGVEPQLDAIVAETVSAGRLGASHEIADLADADVVLVCVQTDKRGIAPDYDPLFAALDGLADAFATRRTARRAPIVVIESTLAPSSMFTVVGERFTRRGLVVGRDVELANSPNRVMPGRLVERVATSDKLIGALKASVARAVHDLYSGIVQGGRLHVTNSLTAEIVKTLENAYRDVRIAFAAEVMRWCDREDVDFYALRDAVNARLGQEDDASHDPSVVPSGGLLVPIIGVGGHCLPKDGILLWWRALERGDPAAGQSAILESRRVNDEAPAYALARLERAVGSVRGRRLAVLGAAYRADSEDTRNSPALAFAELALAQGADVRLHDPHVRADDPNILARAHAGRLTRDVDAALAGADAVVLAVAHAAYAGLPERLASAGVVVMDACRAVPAWPAASAPATASGLGWGRRPAARATLNAVAAEFGVVAQRVTQEVAHLVETLNRDYAPDGFNAAEVDEVRRLAATCVTGCVLPALESVPALLGEPLLAARLSRGVRG